MTLREFILEASGESRDQGPEKKHRRKDFLIMFAHLSKANLEKEKYKLLKELKYKDLEYQTRINNKMKIEAIDKILKERINEASEDNIYKQFHRKYKNFDIENASEDELRKFVKEYGNITHKSSAVSALYSPKATRSAKRNARQSINLSSGIESLLGDKYKKAREKLKGERE